MIVKHPTLADVQYDVRDDQAQSWVDAGWVAEQAPTSTGTSPEPEVTPEADEPSRPSNTRKKA
ncbi:hypothetical protein JOJ87_001429 [Rhodococcus ruber]|uniref:hypothetical protein n=1 Tax=Rhodococcus ruber TaxID=1830 RepID=UPI001AE8B501|nr:hypothetical protein [Rhodococcus ruber]MBP2211085.1 hypothetical protein [Rhodococcus ruber]